jgi:two-component sensor histidine kinase
MVLHKEISTAYSKMGRYRKALEHYEEYSQLNDSIYREEANRSFAEMETKYESEKQKQEISQLKLEQTTKDLIIRKQRSQRNLLLLGILFAILAGGLVYRSYRIKKKANSEKEALLKEIHHRVKNNLQIISSLLSIQTDKVTDRKVIDAVQESQSRVKAMALIHQLLYQDEDITQIDFSVYLPQLVNAVASIFKKNGTEIQTTIQADGIALDIDTAVPLGLITAELASNAFKYAFNQIRKGALYIVLEENNNEHYKLKVADNGPGMPDTTEVEKLQSMGLRLVNILTEQLDGHFSYCYNKGSEFSVEFSTIH